MEGNSRVGKEIDLGYLLMGIPKTTTISVVNVDEKEIHIRPFLGGPACGQHPADLLNENQLFDNGIIIQPGESIELVLNSDITPGEVCFEGWELEIFVNVNFGPPPFYDMTPDWDEIYDRGLIVYLPVKFEIVWWDVTSDGRVDIFDLITVGIYFGRSGRGTRNVGGVVEYFFTHDDPATYSDINKDGRVDVLDLVVVASHFGEVYLDDIPHAAPVANKPRLGDVKNSTARRLIEYTESGGKDFSQFIPKKKVSMKGEKITTWGAIKRR
jgi:hypothetical protein